MKKYIGCDLGGTNLRAALVDTQTGEIATQSQVATKGWEGQAAVMRRIAGLVDEVIAASGFPKSQVGGIGIGVPGRLDLEKGETLFLPNLPGTWPHAPLAATVSSLTGLPVHLLNDVRAITFGEWKFGAGRGFDTIAVFAIGTGIGGGLVINNRLHLGIGGTAGELGHQTIDANGPLCGCGNRGCLEAFASGPAIAALGMKAVTQGLTTQITALVEHDLNRVTSKVIARAALEGDPIAREIFEQAGAYIGIAVANVMVAVTPQRVVIGGGVARAGELLLEPIRRSASQRVFLVPKEQIEIVPARLVDNAGSIGAALWALERSEPGTMD